jgi:hypothetical protein
MSKASSKRYMDRLNNARPAKVKAEKQPEETAPDWSGKCEVCGQSPIVPFTGMCGPCTFGEADTVDGNW